MSNRPVNLKDVAAKAGVSITTVSHVINKTRFVKPETAAAVENAIKELNYVHNLAARTLRSKKSEIIGVMINGFENPYFLEILQGIEHILSEKGYQMILGNTGRSMDAQEKQLDIFNSWCVDGIITYGQGYQNLFQKYDSLNCPVVCIESPAGNVHVSAWMTFLPFPALNLLDESEYHTGRILCADLYGCVYYPCAS